MKRFKKLLIAIFFMVWDRWIYEELNDLVEKTETPIDNMVLEQVNTLIETLEDEFAD